MILEIDGSHFLEKIIISIVILVAVAIGLRILYGIVDRVFNDDKPGIEPREARRLVTLNKVVKTFARAAIWVVAIIMILGQYMDVASLLAVAGVGTLAIGFGAQGIVEDVMSGFVIVFENQFSVGDYITIDESHYGIVESIGIRTSTVREFTGGLFIIHNGKIDRLVNFSKGHIKAAVDVSVAYEENIDKVTDILKTVCHDVFESHEDLFNTPPEVLGVTRLDPSGMNIRIISDEDATGKFQAEIILRQKIKEAFDKNGIEIPYNKSVVFYKESKEQNNGD
ncbi:mechanosensitive ion channel protein MscS [Acetobacterium bakii]|uniref:Mechanosensitive ion channel protein MscS n=2 Tax=Acetobacterium bakii TaxID=52689 RepID=A0A0L6U2C8_9FIRM|nr:mechanosensitive ion channel protein MscS [Acetobacterium bakii]